MYCRRARERRSCSRRIIPTRDGRLTHNAVARRRGLITHRNRSALVISRSPRPPRSRPRSIRFGRRRLCRSAPSARRSTRSTGGGAREAPAARVLPASRSPPPPAPYSVRQRRPTAVPSRRRNHRGDPPRTTYLPNDNM